MRYGAQKQIAEQVGISQRWMSKLYKGRAVASRALSIKLEKVTGIRREKWLFSENTELRALLDSKYS